MKKLLEKLKKLVEKPLEKLKKWWGGVDYTTSETGLPTGTTPSATSDAVPTPPEGDVPYGDLDFCWGGFRGGSAKLVKESCIKNLKIRGDGMSYSWESGGCEKLGAKDRSDAGNTLACLFCKNDGRWRGGKFDWISTSRTSRSFENINGGYNGWDPSAISKAEKYAFVIVSKDGKRRTNVITCGR